MKKIFTTLTLLSVLFIVSCSEDNEDLTVDKKEVTLNYSDTHQIVTNQKDVNYFSQNEFIAKVDENGLITAGRVGEAVININNSPLVKVIVEPKYKIYDIITEFGMSKSAIISKLGTPDAEAENSIGYLNSNSNIPMIMYVFNNDKLSMSSALAKPSTPKLTDFLIERYMPVAIDSETYTAVFINSLNPDLATMLVGMTPYNISYWMIGYAPYDKNTKSIDREFNKNLIDELMSKLKY